MTQNRSASWVKIFRDHNIAFQRWLEQTRVRQKNFEKISDCLEKFIIDSLHNSEKCRTFAQCLIPALRNSKAVYSRPEGIIAYTHLHFLERYHRFWDVCLELLKAGVLPMRDSGIDILDVGTGPAPSIYAVQDFYRELVYFGQQQKIKELLTPLPNLEIVESNYYMCFFIHLFSELCRRNGPYHRTFADFHGLDLRNERLAATQSRIQKIADEDDTSEKYARWWVYDSEPWWKDAFRYNLVIFSNFLTESNQFGQLMEELTSVFNALRNGGVVVVVGGTGKHYPELFKLIDNLAKTSQIRRIDWIPDSIPCVYNDYHGDRIKELFNKIWLHISRIIEVREFEKTLLKEKARDVWDPLVPYRSSQSFGLRVYRKGKIRS